MLRRILKRIGLGLLTIVVMVAVVMRWFPQWLPADAPNPYAVLTPKPLRGGAYVVEGGLSTTGFIIGDTGVIVIDTQMFAEMARNVQRQIAQITPNPVNLMILTHSDPDHVNALPAYPRGLEIIAQEHTKSDILAELAHPRFFFSKPPAEIKNYLPTHLVQDREELVRDGVRMVLLHVAPAHTDGDLVVYLPYQKMVFAGDILTPTVGPYPGIHLEKRGSSLGWIKTIQALLALDADLFVAGHGEPQTRADLQRRLQAAVERREQIVTLVAQHKTLEEVKASFHDVKAKGIAGLFPTYTETTYLELTTAQPVNP